MLCLSIIWHVRDIFDNLIDSTSPFWYKRGSSSEEYMAQVCQITGKRPRVGNTVSHANNKAKRRFNINLHNKRFWSEEQKRFIRLRVSTHGMRIIDKVGLKKALENSAKYRA
jgi:large subunit ribosomal protein L28